MAVFKPGQTVTYRGKSGVVEAVDRTPGMVDVRYGRLVKRHSASDLAQGAKSNPRRPRRSRRAKANPAGLRSPRRSDKLNQLIRKHEEAISYRKWKAIEADWAQKSEAEKKELLAAFDKAAQEVRREQGILRPEDYRLLLAEKGVLATYKPLQEKWDEEKGLRSLFKTREGEEAKALKAATKALQSDRRLEIEKITELNKKIDAYNTALEQQPDDTKKPKQRKDVPEPLSDEQAKKAASDLGFWLPPTFENLVGLSEKQLRNSLRRARVALEKERRRAVEQYVPTPPKLEKQIDMTPKAVAARETERIRRQGEAALVKRSAKVTPTPAIRKQQVRVRSGERAPAYFGDEKVGFEARADPPRFPVVNGIPQLNNLCGNPIDGTIYILAVKEKGDQVRRDISRVTTDADVQEAREQLKRDNNGVDSWPTDDPAKQLKLMVAWLKEKGFFETYLRYKVNERTERGRVKEPYSAADVEYINEGGVFLTGTPRVRKARKSMTPKGRLQISGKSRSQGLFSKAQLPRETYFFPAPDGDGFVALVAIKRVVPADAQLKEFQPRFPYGSSKRRSPFFAWQKLYRPFYEQRSPAEGQLGCETLAGKDAREAAATLKFKLLPLKSALQNLVAVASSGEKQGKKVTSKQVATAIQRLLNAMTAVGNDVLPVVELYCQSRARDSIIKSVVTPQIAMVPAIVSFPESINRREKRRGGLSVRCGVGENPDMIPLSWFEQAFTGGFVPLFTPNRDLQSNLNALLETSRGGTGDARVAEIIAELQAGGSMPPPMQRNAFVCGRPNETTGVDDLDVFLMMRGMDENTNDPAVASRIMADIIKERYTDNFGSIASHSRKPYTPLNVEALTQQLINSDVFQPLPSQPEVRDVDALIANMQERSSQQVGPDYWKHVREKLLRSQKANHSLLEAAAVARCRRGGLYLFYSLGGPNLVKALEGAVKNLDAIIDYGGEIHDFEVFRKKGAVTKLLSTKPYAMSGRRSDLGAQFYYTFNPALAILTQKMWNTGSPFTEGDETELGSAAQDMNMKVQQVGVYGEMLKASYENTALAERAYEAYVDEAGDDDAVRLNELRDLTLNTTDQTLLIFELRKQMQKKLPLLYGRVGNVDDAFALMGSDVEAQRAVMKVIDQVKKDTRRGGQQDRRTAGLPYQDRTITDRDMSRMLAEWAVLFMAMGDGALGILNQPDKSRRYGSLSMFLSPESAREALTKARQRAEEAILSASTFADKAYYRYVDRREERVLGLEDDLAAAKEDLIKRGFTPLQIKDFMEQAEKAATEEPPFAGQSLGLASQDSPRHSARNRLTGVRRKEPSYFPAASPLAALETASSDVEEVESLLDSLLKGSVKTSGSKPNPRSRRPRRKRR